MIYIIALEALLAGITIYSLQDAQIATLKQNEILTKVPNKYLDFLNVFSKKKP